MIKEKVLRFNWINVLNDDRIGSKKKLRKETFYRLGAKKAFSELSE